MKLTLTSVADRREGMVVAYDYYGEYVGCMGIQTWRWLAAHPEMDAQRLERAEAAEAEVARLRDGLRQARECCARPAGTCFDPALLADQDGAA